MRAKSAGGVQSFVSLGFLRNFPFPLPPLAEQRRIVAKVDQLMALVDQLKRSLRTPVPLPSTSWRLWLLNLALQGVKHADM